MQRRPNCSCAVCDKKIYRRPLQIASGKIYCSAKCCGSDQRVARVCSICNTIYLGNKRTCSRVCANIARSGMKYDAARLNDRARKGTLLKEKVANKYGGVCMRCGNSNYSILQIHHKREKYRGGTDALTNLELLCPNCHMTHHLGVSLFKK